MDLTCEDVLMFALDNHMPAAIKSSLSLCQHDLKNMSVLCQARLAIATLPVAILKTDNPASFISGELLLAHSQLLRGLKFIRENWKNRSGFSHYALASIKLQKVVLMHLVCSDTDAVIIEEQLQEGFLQEAEECLAQTKDTRFKTVLKREVNSFKSLVKSMLCNEQAKAKYIQQTMWLDFNEEFWKELETHLLCYVNAVKDSFPPLKVDKLSYQECSQFDDFPTQALKVKRMHDEPILEEDILNFLTTLANKSLVPANKVPTCTVPEQLEEALFAKLTNLSSKSFYGAKRKPSCPLNNKSSNILQESTNNVKQEIKPNNAKRKHYRVFSPKEVQPAKRAKLLSAKDAMQLLLNSDSETENTPKKVVSPIKNSVSLCIGSAKQSKAQSLKNAKPRFPVAVKTEAPVESNSVKKPSSDVPCSVKRLPVCYTDSVAVSGTKNSTSKKRVKLMVDEKTHNLRKLPSRRKIHFTRSLRKQMNNKSLFCGNYANSSPKLKPAQRDLMSKKLQPLTRRKLAFNRSEKSGSKTENDRDSDEESLCEPFIEENVSIQSKCSSPEQNRTFNVGNPASFPDEFTSDKERNQNLERVTTNCDSSPNLRSAHSSCFNEPEVDGLGLKTLDDSSCSSHYSDFLVESDCESEISINLGLDQNQFPDFTLLPIQQACYTSSCNSSDCHLKLDQLQAKTDTIKCQAC